MAIPAAFVIDLHEVVHLVDRFGRTYCGRDLTWRYERALEPEHVLCPGCDLNFEVAKLLSSPTPPSGETPPESSGW